MDKDASQNALSEKQKDAASVPRHATLSELTGGLEVGELEGGGGPGAALAGVVASGSAVESAELPDSLVSSAKQAARESKETQGQATKPENPPSTPETFLEALPAVTGPLQAQTAPNGTLGEVPKSELPVVQEGMPVVSHHRPGNHIVRRKLERSESKMVSAVRRWQKAGERVGTSICLPG